MKVTVTQVGEKFTVKGPGFCFSNVIEHIVRDTLVWVRTDTFSATIQVSQ
jgi:hypothetical protein